MTFKDLPIQGIFVIKAAPYYLLRKLDEGGGVEWLANLNPQYLDGDVEVFQRPSYNVDPYTVVCKATLKLRIEREPIRCAECSRIHYESPFVKQPFKCSNCVHGWPD